MLAKIWNSCYKTILNCKLTLKSITMIIKEIQFGGNQWMGVGRKKRMMGGEYYRSILYMCVKMAQWNQPKTSEGSW
jgi:hypothetical protein